MKFNHTALPWKYEYGSVYSNDGRIVATRKSEADIYPSEKDANLAYIAKACNAYPGLVSALKAIADMQVDTNTDCAQLVALCKAVANTTLAQARGPK